MTDGEVRGERTGGVGRDTDGAVMQGSAWVTGTGRGRPGGWGGVFTIGSRGAFASTYF